MLVQKIKAVCRRGNPEEAKLNMAETAVKEESADLGGAKPTDRKAP